MNTEISKIKQSLVVVLIVQKYTVFDFTFLYKYKSFVDETRVWRT